MKKILLYIATGLTLAAGQACKKNLDNYDGPSETFKGSVIDSTTGKPMQCEIGSGGIRIQLDDLSWSDNPTPFYFYGMQDGTFNNTKIFKGNFRVSVDGPFVPLLQKDNSGNILVDRRQTMQIQGVTTATFWVAPMLKVEWVGDPVLNADSTVSVTVKFSRGTVNPAFQNNITDLFLFVNSNQYTGNNNYDNRYSTRITYNGNAANAQLGQPVTIKTTGKLPAGYTYFLRVGARTDFGQKQYNYNEVKSVNVPAK